MPSVSKKQHNLMAAVAKNPAFAKKVGIKQSVGEDFITADKGKKFGTGGDVNYSYGGKGQANKQRTRFGSSFGYKLNAPDANNDKYAGLKAGGTIREDLQKVNKKETDHGQSKLFKEGGKTMATKKLFGGKETFKEELNEAKAIKSGKISPMQYAKGEESEKKMNCGGKVKKMAKGGGIEVKGKTKGRIC